MPPAVTFPPPAAPTFPQTAVALLPVGMWLLFEVIFPLLPVALIWVGGKVLPKKRQSLFQLVKDGQLFFFCTATVANLIRDLVRMSDATPLTSLLICVLCLLLVAFAGLFGLVVLNKDEVDEHTVGSLSWLCTAVVVCLTLAIRIGEDIL